MYRIKNWEKIYETSESRKVEHLTWVKTPNGHDSLEFKKLMCFRDPMSIYGVWNMLLQIASRAGKEGRNGELKSGETPMNIVDFEVMIGVDKKIIINAIDALISIGWIDYIPEKIPDIRDNIPDIRDAIPDIREQYRLHDMRRHDMRKKEKSFKKEKFLGFEFISMTDDEWNRLIERIGEKSALECLEKLNAFKGSNGKKYKSDYFAIINWVIKEVKKSNFSQLQLNPKTSATLQALSRVLTEEKKINEQPTDN